LTEPLPPPSPALLIERKCSRSPETCLIPVLLAWLQQASPHVASPFFALFGRRAEDRLVVHLGISEVLLFKPFLSKTFSGRASSLRSSLRNSKHFLTQRSLPFPLCSNEIGCRGDCALPSARENFFFFLREGMRFFFRSLYWAPPPTRQPIGIPESRSPSLSPPTAYFFWVGILPKNGLLPPS